MSTIRTEKVGFVK